MTLTNSVLLNDVVRVMKSTKNFSRETYRAKGKFASDTVERHFGSWSTAVKKASKAK